MDFDVYKRIHTSFKDVSYFDDEHVYYSNGKKMISVTTLKKKFMEPFDKEYWAIHEALKRLFPQPKGADRRVLSHARRSIPNQHIAVDGLILKAHEWKSKYLQEYNKVIFDWEAISLAKRTRGTEIHRYLEIGTYGKYDTSERITACDKFLTDKAYQVPVALELVVASRCRRLAGQLDRLTYDPLIEGLELGDYKIDESITFSDDWGKKMKAPFEYLDHTEGNGYIVQLNTYRQCLEDAGVPIKRMVIYNIREAEDTYLEVEVPRIQIDIDNMFNDNPRGNIYSTRGITSTCA